MAVSFIAASAVTSVAGGANPSLTAQLPAGTAAGDRVYYCVVSGPNGTATSTPSGWSKIVDASLGTGALGAATGPRQFTVLVRDYDGVWTMPVVSVTTADANAVMVAAAVTFRKSGTEEWVTETTTTGSDTTTGTSFSVTGAANISLTSGDFVLAMAGTSGNVTATVPTLTATGATFANLTERVDSGTTNGNDASIKLHTADVTAGPSSAAPVHGLTLSAASDGGAAFVRVRSLVTPPVVPTEATVGVTAVDPAIDTFVVSDTYTRADSATTLGTAETGQTYTQQAGSTWGISGNRAYNTSPSTSVNVLVESGLNDVDVRGIINFGAGGSLPGLAFRALNDSNRLGIFIDTGGNLFQLWRMDAGTNTAILSVAATLDPAIDYQIRVVAQGANITGYLDGVQVLHHTLIAADATKFTGAGYTKVGWRGSTQTRFDNLRAGAIAPIPGTAPASTIPVSVSALDASVTVTADAQIADLSVTALAPTFSADTTVTEATLGVAAQDATSSVPITPVIADIGVQALDATVTVTVAALEATLDVAGQNPTVTPPAGGTVGSRTATLVEAAAATTITGTLPTGLANGDVVVVTYGNSSAPANFVPPSGYTQLFAPIAVISTVTMAAYYKVITNAGTETGPSASWTTSGRCSVVTQAYTGVDNAIPLDVTPTTASATATTLNVPGVTTITNGAMLVSGCVINSSTTTDATAPVGMTDIGHSNVDGRRTVVAQQTFPTAGATGVKTWTISAAGIASSAYLAALRPSGTAVAPTLTYSWVGVPTDNGFTVSTKTSDATSVRLKVATDSGLTTGVTFSSAATPDAAGWAKCTVTGRSAATAYYYGVEMTGSSTVTTASIAAPRTLPTDNVSGSFSVGYGSCLTSSTSTATAFTNLKAKAPDLFFHLGDFHYANSTSTSQTTHRQQLEDQIAINTGLRNVLNSTPTIYIKSDHDAGGGNGALPGAWTPSNRAAHLQVVPHPAQVDTNALYFSMRVGRVKFIFMDLRYLRTATQMLGTTQMQWVKDQLITGESVKILVTDSPWLVGDPPLDTTLGNDKWSDYPADHTELGNFIAASAVGRVIAIHGDTHCLCADDGSNNTWGSFPVLGAAPFSNTTSIKGGPYSKGTWPTAAAIGTTEQQYGILTFTDIGSSITVDYVGYGTSNVARITHSVVVPLLTDVAPPAATLSVAALDPTVVTSGAAEVATVAVAAQDATVTISPSIVPDPALLGVAAFDATVDRQQPPGTADLFLAADVPQISVQGAANEAALGLAAHDPSITFAQFVIPDTALFGVAANTPTFTIVMTPIEALLVLAAFNAASVVPEVFGAILALMRVAPNLVDVSRSLPTLVGTNRQGPAIIASSRVTVSVMGGVRA